MFITSLFIIAKTQGQPSYPSVGEKIVWYIHTIKYCSVLKRNARSAHEKTQQNFECLLVSGRSQSERVTYGVVPTL